MPQVIAVISTAVSAFKASALGTFLATTTGRLLASVAIVALQSALAPKQKSKSRGIETDFTSAGGTNPCSFVLGRYATAGNAVSPPMSHGDGDGTPNGYLTYVIDLGDMPCGAISRVLIDGRYATIGTTPHELYGLPLLDDFVDNAWVQFHDGTQSVADATLMAIYSAYPERPWTADMIGRDVPHAILTFRYNTGLYGGVPEVRFEVDGIPVYDPRLDSTVGGAGAQRWATPATWAISTNPMVLIYNILRGITLPDLGVWGGGFDPADLPLGAWFTAMNECDVAVQLEEGGSEPAFRAGVEVKVDQTPAEVIEILLAACNGQLADIGGVWKPRVGGPGLPVLFFTDDDVVASRAQEFRPFPSLDDRHNAISASYPEPEIGWDPKDAPPIYNTVWEAQDGGRRLERTLSLSAVPYASQVQRLMHASIAESRRFYEHSLVLPPDAAILEPLDSVAWTSARHQYTSKTFEVGEVADDQQRLLQAVALRERDDEDHIWLPEFTQPYFVPSSAIVKPPVQSVPGWSALGMTLFDSVGSSRKPAIALMWNGADQEDVLGLQWELRLAGTETVVLRGSTQNVTDSKVIVSAGIIPAQSYEARGMFVVPRPTDWSDWEAATTPDVRLTEADIGAGAVSVAAFAAGIEPVTIVASGPLPTVRLTGSILYAEKLYRWNGTAYVATVPTSDLTGTVTTAQIADAALTTAKFANGIEPVGVIAGTVVPTTKTTEVITVNGKLYRWNGTAYVASVPTVDLTGTVTTAQIANAAVTTAKFANGIEPVAVIAGTVVPTTKTTTVITVDGKLYRWNGIAYVASVPTADLTGTITAAQIAANTITAAQIAADTITGSQIAAGAISASEIAAGAVTATKLLVGDVTNMVLNDWSRGSLDGWTVQGQLGFVNDVAIGAASGWKYSSNARNQAFPSSYCPVVEGEQYYLGVWVYNTATESVSVALNTLDPAGVNHFSQVASLRTDVKDAWVYLEGIVTIPTGDILARMYLSVDKAATGGGATFWTHPVMRRAAAGELIVDGAITAAKIAANTITAAQIAANTITAAQIAANTITAAQIAADTITGSQIAAGAISASEIAAGAVTATKLLVGDVTNMVLNDWSRGSLDGWTVQGQLGFVNDVAIGAASGWKYSSNARNQAFPSSYCPVVEGEQYYLGVWVYNTATERAIVVLNTLDPAGVNHFPQVASLRTDVKDAWVYLEGIITIPAGDILARMYLSVDKAATGGGATFWTHPVMRRAMGGELIVDGAITAAKIAANTITAAQIAAGTITATQIAADTITAAQIAAGAISASEIATNAVKVDNIEIDTALVIDAVNAGFSMGKTGASDFSADGLYMGRDLAADLSTGFGFLMGKTSPAGLRQYLRHTTDDGLSLINANYGLYTNLESPTPNITVSGTTSLLPVAKTLSLTFLGGGAGGNDAATGGNAGGTTTVRLYNGTTLIQTWTAAGGTHGVWSSRNGQSSLFGTGGSAARRELVGGGDGGNEVFYPASAATGYGSGGYGAGGYYEVDGYQGTGGGAAVPTTVTAYDISALSDPKLTVTIGAGGTGINGGGSGTPGMVKVEVSRADVVPAGVIPFAPTAVGSFVKAASATGATVFPDLGIGMWVLTENSGAVLGLNSLEIDTAGTRMVLTNALESTFIANKRPVIITGNATARTIKYAFYKMKV